MLTTEQRDLLAGATLWNAYCYVAPKEFEGVERAWRQWVDRDPHNGLRKAAAKDIAEQMLAAAMTQPALV